MDSGDTRVKLLPEPAKTAFWLQSLRFLLEHCDDLMSSSLVFESLVGRLCFACFSVWGPRAKSRLMPLYPWIYKREVSVDKVLQCLRWWEDELLHYSGTIVCLRADTRAPLILYTDAEGSGGLGAVMVNQDSSWWFSARTPDFIVSALAPRKTQINGLELLGVWMALSVWKSALVGRTLLLFVDNTSALAIVIKGSSKSEDLNVLGMAIRDLCSSLSISLHAFWVPSALNGSDPPSRGSPPFISTSTPSVARVRWESLRDRLREVRPQSRQLPAS